MFQQHLAGEDEADALPIGFGGEEGGEELLLRFSADAPSVIGYLNGGAGRRRGGEDDFSFIVPDTFYRILYDVLQHLCKERCVNLHRQRVRTELQAEADALWQAKSL